MQDSKQVSFSRLEQVDFHAGQVSFHSHLPAGQRLAQAKQNLRAACPKTQAAISVFSSLECS